MHCTARCFCCPCLASGLGHGSQVLYEVSSARPPGLCFYKTGLLSRLSYRRLCGGESSERMLIVEDLKSRTSRVDWGDGLVSNMLAV